MTARRRIALAATIVVASMGLAGSPARADESVTTGEWAGSTLLPSPRPCDNNDVCGRIQRSGIQPIDVVFSVQAVATSAGCALPTAPRYEDASSPVAINRGLAYECNGTYRTVATASVPIATPGSPQQITLDRVVQVADPAPDVPIPSATAGADRSVTVSWTPLANAPKDFRGYLVLRTLGGTTEAIATLPSDASSWTDTTVPAEGGAMSYQVRTRRAGSNPVDPADEVTSSGASSDPVEVAPAPEDPGGTDGGDGGGGAGGGTDGGSNGGSSSGGSGGAPVVGGAGRPSSSIRVPRVGTPSRSFFPPLLAPPTDAGFSQELPFEDREPGEDDPVLPDDGLASGTTRERLPGRGLAVPVATGLVLAVWALHLRFLARAARPEYVDDDRIEIIVT